MKAPEVLQAALGHMQDRATTYDKPTGERSMARTVTAFNAITGHTLTEEQGWLLMGVLKQVRSQSGGFRADNYEDEAAYAALRAECAYAARGGIPLRDLCEVDLGEPLPEFDEARVDRVASSHGDGEHYAETVQVGDWVEVVDPRDTLDISAGGFYRVHGIEEMLPWVIDDAGEESWIDDVKYKFHARPDADGWIEWGGGVCPVGGDALVDYRTSDREECDHGASAHCLRWNHIASGGDIIAYRPYKPEYK